MSDKYRELLFAICEMCQVVTPEEFRALNNPARVALVQLALLSSSTQVSWWEEWTEYCSIMANMEKKNEGMFE